MSSVIFAHDLEDAERGENQNRINEKSRKRTDAHAVKSNPESPYAKYATPDARIWGLYLEEAEAEDRELMEPWNKDLDSLLIFAGLFAGILTAFLIESRKELYEDPQIRLLKDILGTLQNAASTPAPEPFEPDTSFLNINGLWFTSLTLTLSSALGGVLSKGWIAKHSNASTRKTSNDAYARHLRASRIRKWRVGAIISVISLLIQIALFLFFVGLVLILWDATNRIKFTILALVAMTSLIYLVITFLPWIFPACPLQTPITEGTPWITRPMIYDQRPGSSGIHRGGGDSSPLTELVSLYRELRSVPEPQELRAQIIAWVISNTLDEKVLKETLKALAGIESTPVLWDILSESGALTTLKTRLPQYLTQARTSKSDEEWVCIILYLMLQFELRNPSRESPTDSLFQSLLSEGGALHRWQDFRPHEQPLACILRLHILMNGNTDDSDTSWEGHILGLVKVVNDSSVAWMKDILFDAATRGVKNGKENIRRMCSVITSDLLLSSDIQALSHRLEGSNNDHLGNNWARNYTMIPQALCKLCLDGDPGVREAAIEALTRTSADHQLCMDFESAFEELVAMRNRDQIPGIMVAITALVRNDKLRKYMKRGTNVIAQLVENEQHECWEGSVNASIILSHYAELRSGIKHIIPKTVKLFASEVKVRDFISYSMRCFADQAAFETEIRLMAVEVTKLLGHESAEIRISALQGIKNFASQGHELPVEVNAAIQKIVELLTDSSDLVRSDAVNALKEFAIQAKFQSEIKAGLPNVIGLLSDSSQSVRENAVKAIDHFATHADFQAEITHGIPKIIELFAAKSCGSLLFTVADAIGNIARQTEFQAEIKLKVPRIVEIYSTSTSQYGPLAVARAIERLAMRAEFHSEIKVEIPKIVELLNSSNLPRHHVVQLIGCLATQEVFKSELKAAVPQIIQSLPGMNSVDAIEKFAIQGLYEPEINSAIPELIELLSHSSQYFQDEAVKALGRFARKGVFISEINNAMPRITELLACSSQPVQINAIKAIGSLAGRAEFHTGVKAAIPKIVKLLDDPSISNRADVVIAVVEFATQAELQTEIRAAIPTVVELLSDRSNWVRSNAVNVIANCATHAELQSEIKVGVSKLVELLSDRSDYIQGSVIKAIGKIATQGRFQSEVDVAMPQIVKMLNENSLTIGMNTERLLKELATQKSSLHHIQAVLPDIVGLLLDPGVGRVALKVIEDIATHVSFSSEFEPIAPVFMNWLHEHDSEVQTFAISATRSLITIAEFRSHMEGAIPLILSWLTLRNQKLRVAALNIALSLAQYNRYHPEIQEHSRQIAGLLGDQYPDVRVACISLLCSPKGYGIIAPKILSLIPRVTGMLADVDREVRSATAKALIPLAQDVTWRPTIEEAFSHYRFLLEERDMSALRDALNGPEGQGS